MDGTDTQGIGDGMDTQGIEDVIDDTIDWSFQHTQQIRLGFFETMVEEESN